MLKTNIATSHQVSPEEQLKQKTLRRHPILLDYRDAQLEREFLHFYAEETRPLIQAAFVLSVPVWIIGLSLLFFLIPQHAMMLSMISASVSLPFALFALFIRNHPRCLGYYQPLGLFSNIATGLLVMLICYYLEAIVPHIMMIGMMLMLFIGFYALRLRARYAITSSLILMGSYAIYIDVFSTEDEAAQLLITNTLMIFELFACMTAWLSEYTYRKIFEQQTLIAMQKNCISKEHERAELLLLNILPPSIAERLQDDEQVIADHFDQVAILFADIVGFTKLSSNTPANELVSMLNTLFSSFDELVGQYQLEKIKTIGDAYMVAAGMPQRATNPAPRLADFALHMQTSVDSYNQQNNCDIQLRIGIHVGPVIAGVIGIRKFIYDVWGDTVNIASRMESHSEKGKIQLSDSAAQALAGLFEMSLRGNISIKGKGEMRTWYLKGRIDNTQQKSN